MIVVCWSIFISLVVDGRRTEARDAFASEGFEAHFVGCVAQKVVFVWDAPYEGRLERGALFDDVFDLGR